MPQCYTNFVCKIQAKIMYFLDFLLVAVNLVNAILVNLLNKLQSQIGGHKLVN